MRVHLGGHLNFYDRERRAWLEVPAPEPLSLLELCARLNVPPEEVGVAAINGVVVALDEGRAKEGDTVEFYSPVGGG